MVDVLRGAVDVADDPEPPARGVEPVLDRHLLEVPSGLGRAPRRPQEPGDDPEEDDGDDDPRAPPASLHERHEARRAEERDARRPDTERGEGEEGRGEPPAAGAIALYIAGPSGILSCVSPTGQNAERIPRWILFSAAPAVAATLVALFFALGLERLWMRLIGIVVAFGLGAATFYVVYLLLPADCRPA